MNKSIRQFVKFGLVGILNTGVDLAVLNAETLVTGIKEGYGFGIQKGLSFLVAVTFSYFLNKRWTFEDKSQEEQGKKFSQFIFVSVIGILVNVAAATIAVTYLKHPVNDLLGNPEILSDQIWVSIGGLTGTAAGLLWNFFGYKFWVFKK